MEMAFSVVMILIAFAAGFYLIYFLEKKDIYNLFAAILMPCMGVFSISILISAVAPIAIFLLLPLIPLLMISASIGGVWAHKKRKKQHSSKIS
ncbi:hypothetical protein [Mucilaginibacter sp.]|uniref:hypothetical protein n=1 Tax=Mucilaginibacter sp. TaxID=1882438 RepID=UPI0026082015|nr:hypothetical protein [Mucilaginibacter sp.]MDB5125864.1 hypothetical protein [Mucilaginibacter sp.]